MPFAPSVFHFPFFLPLALPRWTVFLIIFSLTPHFSVSRFNHPHRRSMCPCPCSSFQLFPNTYATRRSSASYFCFTPSPSLFFIAFLNPGQPIFAPPHHSDLSNRINTYLFQLVPPLVLTCPFVIEPPPSSPSILLCSVLPFPMP